MLLCFWCEIIDLVGFFGCYCLTPSYYEVSDRGQTLAVVIGVRAGGGGRGGLQPPQILGNSDFLDSKRKFGQSQVLKTFPCFIIIIIILKR